MRLLEAGLGMLLEHGYNDLGIQDLLDRTGVPKGSFYHHFQSKEGFALEAVDLYMSRVHAQLDASFSAAERPPLLRVRDFFEHVREAYASEGYRGCLLGALGQELSGVNDVFREKIEGCLATVVSRIAVMLNEARQRGDLPWDTDPEAMANVLVDAWEGAALRSRLIGGPAPLNAILDFYFRVVAVG